ncbi:D-alanine--D-alanine ligase [Desulfocucumis palustris]|uniref:D-alanine--D-alanine ligase n=1 Tax=Desulfocucumis palustris TaxID=1898651 RepID=A0A2L2XF29_9FIRM|nr:D-alanine--D-alanine ligase [Desulfocucumis palustris]GBF34959.1 D-alanine--D-alanine ligase [Desulfocucumis palustris]
MSVKIGVLLGGRSAEREVSLRTGGAIYNALVNKGYDAVKIDVAGDFVGQLKNENITLAFLALHGPYGEDGTIQGLLEMLGIPYTGSGVLSSAMCMNKIATKKILIYEGLPTPDFLVVDVNTCREKGMQTAVKEILGIISLPLVVKAPTQGSTIGITFAKEAKDVAPALEEAFKYGREALVEKMIGGIEITSSVLGNDNPVALPLIEIVSATGVYDYTAKYTAGLSDHIIPPRIPAEIQETIKNLAVKTFKALGCRGLARVDFILDPEGKAYILEVNTIPGMTETSLYPDSARAAGIEFDDLAERLVNFALER